MPDFLRGFVLVLLGVWLSAGGADAARWPQKRHAPVANRYDGWVSVEPRHWPADRKLEQAGPPMPAQKPTLQGASQAEPQVDVCFAGLPKEGITARRGTVPPSPPDSTCGIDNPVNLISVTAGEASIHIAGEPLVSCETAKAFGGFVRDIVAPLARGAQGSPLKSIAVGGGYECRPRNHVTGAKPSAHGRGLAIDVMSFTFADGKQVSVKDGYDTPFVRAVRTAACGVFTTILGPGSDAAHATHMHLDLERHGSSERYRICE